MQGYFSEGLVPYWTLWTGNKWVNRPVLHCSSHSQQFHEKAVLKYFFKIHRKTLAIEFIFSKVAGQNLELCRKKDSIASFFWINLVNLVNISECLRVIASIVLSMFLKLGQI